MNIKNKRKKEQKVDLIVLYLFAILPFFTGLAKHYQVFGVACVVLLIICIRPECRINIGEKKDYYPAIIFLISVCLSVLIGESKGDAFYGLLRVITGFLLFFLIGGCNENTKEEALKLTPYVGAVMVTFSAIGYFLPGIKDLLFTNERMGGFFQYPNTFALFLLLGFYIWFEGFQRNGIKLKDLIAPGILLLGIFWSGSRTTFVMTVVLILYLAFKHREVRLPIIFGVGLLTTAVIIVLFFFGNQSSFGRFSTISFHSSTFVGRLLYDYDALSMIVKRPLGYGYLGYYLVQQSLQTGVYYVRFIHNDWLQIGVDYGVIAMASFVELYFRIFKNADSMHRMILLIIGVHMMLDFDLQFLSIGMLALLCVNLPKGKSITVPKIGIVILPFFLWLGTADFIQNIGDYSTSYKLYPWAADVELHAMVEESSLKKQTSYANHLLSETKYIGAAYDVLALDAMEQSDYITAIEMKRKAVLHQKYNVEKYDEYVELLYEIALKSNEEDNEELLYLCREYMGEVSTLLDALKEQTSFLAYRINDKPMFQLADESIKKMNNVLLL